MFARGICDPLLWPCEGDPSRVAVADKLAHTPGKHLIMVRYEKDNHNIHDDWVYNGAEIDNAKVLWARDHRCRAKTPSSSRTLAIAKSG